MAEKHQVGPSPASLYRGNIGMWSWVAHRIAGIAVFFFLLIHILDTALVRISPEAYNAVIGTYKNPFMGLVETALVAAIMFHALNGIRVILIDRSRFFAKYQAILFYVVLAIWVVLLIGFAAVHLQNVFAG